MSDSSLILLVDDEQSNLELFSTILEQAGYRTLTAGSSAEALQLLRTNKPDLIISDIYMPQKGGFEFYEDVQRMHELRYVPFIFLSALSDRQHVNEGKQLGADDYLTKPVDIDELVTTVKGKLKRAASLRSAMENEFAELKEQIISTVSHELNTPLTSIIGFSEIISSEDSHISTAELREFANRIRQGGNRLKGLVDDFLETVQIDSGKTSEYYAITRSEFDLTVLLSAIADEFRVLAARKNLKFQTDISGGLHATASEAQVRDIVSRLLANAVKFTSSGSVSISASQKHDAIRIDVTDTGTGMNPKELTRVCEKFYQIDKEQKQQRGAGLGLYIADKLAEINKCKLIVSSSEGAGTTVTLILPIG